MFGLRKKSPEASVPNPDNKWSKTRIAIGAGVLAIITGTGLGVASHNAERVTGNPAPISGEPAVPSPTDIVPVTPDTTTYAIPSTESSTIATAPEVPTVESGTTPAATTVDSSPAETSTGSNDYSAAPAHSDADEARLDSVHESTSYTTLTAEQKATFDKAANAPYETFAQLDYKERALYANVLLRGNYQDVHNMTGASDGKLDTTYFDKHTWADGMGARPDQIADKVEGPANYIGILLAYAYYQGGETGAKLLASAYVDTSSGNEHFNEMLSTLATMQDGGTPGTTDLHFLEGKSYLDRVVANHKVSNSTVSDTPTTIYTADLNNPKKTPSDIQLSLAYSRFETPESGYSMWIIVPNGLNYPTDPNYDASFAPAPGQ